MKKKLPRFLAVHNPMVTEAIYVLHTRKPSFLAEKTAEGFVVVLQMEEGDTAGVLNRMHDWYIAYTVNNRKRG